MSGSRAHPARPGAPGALVYRTRAWNMGIAIQVTDPDSLVRGVEVLRHELDRIDRVASRFRPDSEINAVHRASVSTPGAPVPVSPALLEAVAMAVRMAELTDGALDPTVGTAMCAIGFDRDFAALASGVDGLLPAPAPVPGWRTIAVDRAAGTVTIAPGTILDLGATAKAAAADRIARLAADRGGCGVMVALGGDVAMAGDPPAGGFPVGIAEAHHAPRCAETVAVTSGGIATSGITVRRWTVGDTVVHHIVDPSTGLPAMPVWRTVTVAAATCMEANAASTAAVVKGEAAMEWLVSLGLPARLVSARGDMLRTPWWPQPAPSTGTTAALDPCRSTGVAAGTDR